MFAQILDIMLEIRQRDSYSMGWMELMGGFLLALGNPWLQGISNIALIFLMIGIFYSLLMTKESLIAYAPVTLCLGLLLLLNTRFCYR
ncbi:transmembrane protein 35B [Gracilinanus agilis]|uniref:transmembrane protein 35B n=1 Tax=Gracilinanus agilis TaxID=191870 RepID=UPI001CFC503B|nr:transmembrane protein 35B [Gracilinanus agilis]